MVSLSFSFFLSFSFSLSLVCHRRFLGAVENLRGSAAPSRSSFKMQIVALIFALSAPFPFRTGLPAIGAKRAVHATARLLRARVRVRTYEREGEREREKDEGQKREVSVRDDTWIKSRKF